MVWILDTRMQPVLKESWIDFATIVTAVFAAFLALAGVSNQINSTREDSERVRQSSLKMAKAMLPHSLANMMEVARRGIRFNLNCTHETVEACDCNRDFELSAETLDRLAGLVQYSDSNDGEQIAKLVRMFQMMLSREENSFKDRTASEENVAILGMQDRNLDQAVTWAEIHARTGAIFDYIDGETNRISGPLDETGLSSAFLQSDYFHLNLNPRLLAKVRLREARLTS